MPVAPHEVGDILGDKPLLPESRAALAHALAVAGIEGVGGTLVIKLPRKSSDPVEVRFVTGNTSIKLEA